MGRIDYPEWAGMKAFRQLGIVVLLLGSYLAPAMACMVSDVGMNAEERACCRSMHHHCGQMGMPASHGCCQKAPQSTIGGALVTKAVTSATYNPTAAVVLRLTTTEWLQPTLVNAGWVEHSGYSPPGSPPSSISILRI